MSQPQEQFDYEKEIDNCRHWIEASLERSTFFGIATHNFEDVKAMILSHQAQLWYTDKGCMVTFITHFPQSSMITVWLMGGDFEYIMDKWEERIYDWARSQGCKVLYVMGRKGWTRRLKSRDYVEHATVVSKLL